MPDTDESMLTEPDHELVKSGPDRPGCVSIYHQRAERHARAFLMGDQSSPIPSALAVRTEPLTAYEAREAWSMLTERPPDC